MTGRRRRATRVRVATIVALAVLSRIVPAAAQSAEATAVDGRLLVVPFENARSDASAYWIGEGSAVALTDDLRMLGRAAIHRDNRLRTFDRLQVPAVASLSDATIIRLGQVVGATQVVLGSFEVRGARLTLRVRTIRLETGRMAPQIVEEGPLADLFGVYARVARRIAPESAVPEVSLRQGDPPPAAFEQYVKGLLAESPEARIACLDRALQLAPAFHPARIALWDAQTDAGDPLEALAAVRGVPADDRLWRQARFLASVTLLSLGRNQEALDVLTPLNEADPDPALLNNLGIAQLRRGDSASGPAPTALFSEAARLDGSDEDFIFNLGYATWVVGDGPAAITWLKEAVRRNPADDAAHYVLGVALQAAGNTAEAARERELASRLSSATADWEDRPGIKGVPRGLERVKTEIDIPASLRMESIVVASGQRDQRDLARFHLEAGRRLYQAARDRDAIAELRRAVYLAPYQNEAHLLLGRLYLRNDRAQDAIDAFTIAIWSEDTIVAHLALASAHLAAGNEAEARAEAQLVLAREPGNAEAQRIVAP